ncbi:type III-B CRISPR module-associated protein Cmr5 [Ktedonospora formicarum]|uniref:CRISPR type III-B/RAMP module-associated protein Cmr5 n=1 Tax=Ktedonospora formicarum TaxID=2778364 RepID=A0A8J3MXE5_9CHLR|nr:type III-B CRISPR module-associated protein Cmr5 [Ktedonospora formicarum]GHO49663.1 hypothetical protein KSX_78260 [Ktedonospora formicarum]
MYTRDQQYALHAFEYVTAYKEKEKGDKERNQYGGMAHRLPVLIHSAGLAQALEFVNSRSGKKPPHKQLLTDLSKTIGYDSTGDLLEAVRQAPLTSYMQITYQVRQALLWYKRYAQSILDVEDASVVDKEDEA